jgi:hypothetical protein
VGKLWAVDQVDRIPIGSISFNDGCAREMPCGDDDACPLAVGGEFLP